MPSWTSFYILEDVFAISFERVNDKEMATNFFLWRQQV